MSVHVLSWVLKHSPVENHAERLTLLVFADRADRDGSRAYPAVETIMEEAKIKSATTVRRARDQLEADGHLVFEGISPYRTKSYRVVMDPAYERPIPRNGEPARDPSSADSVLPADPEPSIEPPSKEKELSRKGGSTSPPSADELAVWTAITERLRAELPEIRFCTFVEPLELVAVVGHALTVAAPPHALTSVSERYLSKLTAAARAELGETATVEVTAADKRNEDAA